VKLHSCNNRQVTSRGLRRSCVHLGGGLPWQYVEGIGHETRRQTGVPSTLSTDRPCVVFEVAIKGRKQVELILVVLSQGPHESFARRNAIVRFRKRVQIQLHRSYQPLSPFLVAISLNSQSCSSPSQPISTSNPTLTHKLHPSHPTKTSFSPLVSASSNSSSRILNPFSAPHRHARVHSI
jgi:hypothetical protein